MAVLVAVGGLSGGAASAGAAAPGLVADLTWFPGLPAAERTAKAIEDSGSTWVRLDIGWRDFEPSPGNYSPWHIAAYDRELRRARDAGQRIAVMVHTSPEWASGHADRHAPPRDPSTYARFMRFLAERYGPLVDAWEVWNEPNYARFWPTGPDPVRYTRLLQRAYPAIKSGDPSATVVFGGLSTNDWRFLEAAYDAGAKGYFDALGTHPYSCARSPEALVRDGTRLSRHSFTAYRELRRSMVANGDRKPIWFTEFGWSTSSGECGVTRATQASYLRRAYRLIERDRYVQVATWYSFRNSFWAGDADSLEPQYGLLTTTFEPKPAYRAFRSYARAHRRSQAARKRASGSRERRPRRSSAGS